MDRHWDRRIAGMLLAPLLAPLVTLLAACGMMPSMPSLSVGPFPRTTIPSEIAPLPTWQLQMISAATGVQIYRCDPTAGAAGTLEWALQRPEAILRDTVGKYLGKHYAGPTWEAEDGSKIVGIVEARRDAYGGSIPWLRLSAKSTAGAGLLGPVTGILRVSTTGGQPPAGGCSEVDRGRIIRVDYTADYYFYVKR